MASVRRLLGLVGGKINPATSEMLFDLSVATGGKPLSFIATYGVASQVISGLARMLKGLSDELARTQGVQGISAEQVQIVHVHKERWEDIVILRLTTPTGIPYAFQLSPQQAAETADQLKTESTKPTQTGRA